MAQQMSTPGDARHAKTDLYDTDKRAFYIQYPVWFVVLLALAGVVAFSITGFFGYPSPYADGRPNGLGTVDAGFSSPWVLYLWLCTLLVTLVASVLRDSSLRQRLIAMLVVSLVAIVFIGITQFQNILPDIIKQLLSHHVIFQYLSTNPATYTVVNFGLIAIFWADTIRRWVRFRRGLPLHPRVNIGLGEPVRSTDPRTDTTFSELISGDLLAAALLSLILFGIFRVEVLGLVIHPQGGINTCTLSWPAGACGVGATLHDPPTLAFMDLLQVLIYLPLGLIILALSAMLSGLGAVHAVDNLDLALANTSISAQSGTAPITEDVTMTLFKALRSALDRRMRSLGRNFVLSLRMLGWPALLFVATFGISDLSINIEAYLHSSKSASDALNYALPAVAWGLGAVLCMVGSLALMLFRFRVVDNTFRFLGLIGLVVLLTFWLFSLALWGVNQLIIHLSNDLDHFPRHPFDPPSFATLGSMAALLLFGVLLLVNNARSGGQSQSRASAKQNLDALQQSQPSSVQQPDPSQSSPQPGRRVIEQPYGPPIGIEEPSAPLAQTVRANPPEWPSAETSSN
jgi:hypothetical protein